MNRFINFIIFVLLVLGSVTIVIVSFDLEISTGFRGSKLPYKETIFIVYTIVVGFLLFARSALRWFTLNNMKSFKNVLFEAPISKARKRLNTLFLYTEALYLITFGLFLIWISPLTHWSGWVLIIAFLDTLMFYFITIPGNKARILLTPKAVAVYERELKLVPLANMKEADLHFDQVFIHYKKGFDYQFSIGGLTPEQVATFKSHFLEILNKKNVFISEELRNYKGK